MLRTKVRQRMTSAILLTGVLLGSIFETTSFVCADMIVSEADCHSMTEEWFGNRNLQRSVSMVEGRLANAVSDYFGERELVYTADFATKSSTTFSMRGAEVGLEADYRAKRVDDLQKNANIEITDAKVTALYDAEDVIYNEDGTVTVYIYEWTFFDYDDLSDAAKATDVSGYGTYHKITLEEIDGAYQIVSDEYDESDILGICTIKESTKTELETMGYEPDALVSDEAISVDVTMPKVMSYYAEYDPDAVADYADQYVYHGAVDSNNYEEYYNSAYYNFNADGGDCANYTSQCITAGGMPHVECEKYGSSGWYYKSGADRSATWSKSSYLRQWMGNNRGKLVIATDDSVYKGSPVFYDDSHATICVGKNSAGTPIINSHNYDRYHVPWNYWGEDTTYTTVQLTEETSDAEVNTQMVIIDKSLPKTLDEGKAFSVKGTIVSEVPITNVSVGVYDENGAMVTGKSTFPDTINYNLSLLDNYVKFSALKEGTYEYRVTAENSAGVNVVLINCTFEVLSDGIPFEDIYPNDWYYDAIGYVYKNGIMTGMTSEIFAPYGHLSRAQFALMLYRMENEPEADEENPFLDIAGDEWYADAVIWAQKNGIVTGYENGNFGPADMITREQMAVMMYRYADYLGIDYPDSGNYSTFLDADKVSEFAERAVAWAVDSGIITGKESGTLIDPQGNTTRAEAAVIIQRFMTVNTQEEA